MPITYTLYPFTDVNIEDYTQIRAFGLAINPCEIFRNNHLETYPWLKYIDLAIGANYIPLKDEVTYIIYDEDIDDYQMEKMKVDADVLNIGEILRLKYCFQINWLWKQYMDLLILMQCEQ
jgi:hypothetical protein